MELRLKLQPDPQTMARVAAALRTLGYQAESNAESVAVPSNEGGALVVVTRADGAMFVTLQGGSDDDPHRKELLFLARSLDAAAGPNPDAFLRRLRWALKAKWTPPSFLLDEDPRRERYGSNPRSVGLALRFDGNGQITDLDIDRTSGIAVVGVQTLVTGS